MKPLITLTEVYFIVFLTLITISTFGIGFLAIIGVKKKNIEPLTRTTRSFVIGFALLNLTFFFIGRTGISITFVTYVYFLLSALSLLKLIYQRDIKTYLHDLAYFAVASAIGVWQFFPGILVSSLSKSGMTMVTYQNNDIANYSANASEFLKTGFGPSGHIASIDLNNFDLHSAYLSPTFLIAYISSIFHLSTWQVTTPAIGVAIAISVLALGRLVLSFFPKKKSHIAFIIGSVVMMTSLITYIEGNYFLGQILAIAVSAIIIANTIEFALIQQDTFIKCLEMIGLVILAIYSYPHLTIPILFLGIIFSILIQFRNRKFSPISIVRFAQYATAVLIGFLLCVPYIPFVYALVRTQSSIQAGWSLQTLSPFSMMFFPQNINVKTPGYLNLVMWLGLLVVLIFVFVRSSVSRRDKEVAIVVFMVLLLIIFLWIYLKGQGFQAYDSWKLEAYLFPVLLAILLGFVTESKKIGYAVISVLLGMGLTSAVSLWGLTTATYVNHDLITLRKNKAISSLKALNIQLDPYFETMASVSVISGPTIYTNSTSYWPTEINPSACTLVHLDNKLFRFIQPLNSTYGLASTSRDRCSAVEPRIRMDSPMFFNSHNLTPNGSGWSSPEVWGTWTTANVATLQLPIKASTRGTLSMFLKSSAFLGGGNMTQDVSISINGVGIGAIHFTNTLNLATRRFVIPVSAFNTSQSLSTMRFVIRHPVSPRSLGQSSDERRLGMGLISLTFKF